MHAAMAVRLQGDAIVTNEEEAWLAAKAFVDEHKSLDSLNSKLLAAVAAIKKGNAALANAALPAILQQCKTDLGKEQMNSLQRSIEETARHKLHLERQREHGTWNHHSAALLSLSNLRCNDMRAVLGELGGQVQAQIDRDLKAVRKFVQRFNALQATLSVHGDDALPHHQRAPLLEADALACRFPWEEVGPLVPGDDTKVRRAVVREWLRMRRAKTEVHIILAEELPALLRFQANSVQHLVAAAISPGSGWGERVLLASGCVSGAHQLAASITSCANLAKADLGLRGAELNASLRDADAALTGFAQRLSLQSQAWSRVARAGTVRTTANFEAALALGLGPDQDSDEEEADADEGHG